MRNKLVVIDASVAMKSILPNPLQEQCLALVESFTDSQPVAPSLWAYETTSVITKAIHFGQITETEGRQVLNQLNMLDVHLFVPDGNLNRSAFEWTLRLKRASAYDSYYLALAETLGCDLWTADHRLFNVCSSQLSNYHRKGWLHWIEEMSETSI